MITECAQGRDRIHYVSSGFVRFLRQRKTRIRCPRMAPPESRRARAEEDMIGRGRREEKTETERDRKSIIADTPKPTKHYKTVVSDSYLAPLGWNIENSQFLEKVATKFGFWGQDRIHYVSSGFVRFFFSEHENHGFDAQERRPLKTSRFFFARRQSYQKPMLSSKHKLPFMLLKPHSKLKKNGHPFRKCFRKSSQSYRKIDFLQKNAPSCRKMPSSGGTWQETAGIAGGFQGSRIKNANQLSQDFGRF